MYTIKQVAQQTGLTAHTIRYYDREGLIPLLTRSENGIRQFSQDDIDWINLICCLKNSGMSIQTIKELMQLCLDGEATGEERKALLMEHRKHILEQMDVLRDSLSIVDYKISHYQEIGIFHLHR